MVWYDQSMMMQTHIHHTLQAIQQHCAAHAILAWLVGGAARDLARGTLPADLDLAVDYDGVALARQLAKRLGGAFVLLDDERSTGRVVLPPTADRPALTVDVARLRAASISDDLRQRDVTINALALPLDLVARTLTDLPASAFLDPCGGLADLAARRLRLCAPDSLHADPLRMLRVFRLAASLHLLPDAELLDALRATAPQIRTVAAERVRDELLRLLEQPESAPWLYMMDQVGLLTAILPELEPARTCDQPVVHFLPVLAHTLETVVCLEWLIAGLPPATTPALLPVAVQHFPNVPRHIALAPQLQAHLSTPLNGTARLALLKLATLLHDNAKPQTKQPKPDGGVSFHGHQSIGAEVALRIARRLKLSRTATALVVTIVREHMRPGQLRDAEGVTARAYARFYRDAGDATPEVLLHSLADHMATRGPYIHLPDWGYHLAWVDTRLHDYWLPPPERTLPLLNGHDLMLELGLPPGPAVGDLLREIHEAQAAGEISTRAAALDLARRLQTERRI